MVEAILYTTGCPQCTVLEDKLRSAKISFATNENVEDMIALGMRSAPALMIDGKLLNFAEAMEWIAERTQRIERT